LRQTSYAAEYRLADAPVNGSSMYSTHHHLTTCYFLVFAPKNRAVMPREKQSMKATTTGGTNSMKAILESDLFLTQTRAEICETSKLLASTQTTLTYAEIPFPLVCVIAHLYNINLDELVDFFVCLNLSGHFRFGSKFLLHGYVGSEAFLTLGKQNESSTIMGKSRRPAPPPRDATVDDSSRRSKSASVRRKPSEEHRKRTGSIRQDSSD
ncbi:hypothetical protein GCK32_008636, partial [Trichostrongylus colubriformis]